MILAESPSQAHSKEASMPKMILMSATLLLAACATPAPTSSRMSAGDSSAIKKRAGGAHKGLASRKAATTAKARRKELEKKPQALDTLRKRKPRPEVKPIKKEEMRKARPGWAKNPPTADGTYIYGLGSAGYGDEDELGEAWTQARDRAYTELASQLKVQIKGHAKDYQEEFSQGGKTVAMNSFSEAISSHVDASLEGAELHDRYQDKRQVFVLARFNKAELDALLLARLESLKAEVYDRIAEARSSLSQGKGVNALAAALRAAVARRNLFGMPVDVDGQQADAVIEGLVREASALLRLESSAPVSGRSGDLFSGIGVDVFDKNERANGVPIRFALVGGVGFANMLVSTSGGRAKLPAARIFGRNPRLKASIDLATLASVDPRENRWLKRQFGREMLSLSHELDVRLQVRKLRLDGEIDEAVLSVLGNRLGIAEGGGSKWSMSLQLNDLGCRDLSMRRTCAVDAQLSIADGEGYSLSVRKKVRGTASDDGEASAQIEKRLPSLLIKTLIRNMTGQ
jgi:hypothetical protein